MNRIRPLPMPNVSRSALVILVPAVLHALIDAATHIMKSERIWPEAADLNWLFNVSDVSAIVAIDHARSKLVTPPILCLRAAACGVFPFGFAWQPICLSCCAGEPANKPLGITPAYIRDGRIIFAGRNAPWPQRIHSIRGQKQDVDSSQKTES